MEIEVSVVRVLRIAKGLTQQDLAKRARVSTAALSNIENGRSEASSAVVGRIADALDCSPEELGNGLVAAYVASPIKVRAGRGGDLN